MDENVRRARDLMARSRKEHFAVGAFNVDNQETLVAIARAAQVKNSPVRISREILCNAVTLISPCR